MRREKSLPLTPTLSHRERETALLLSRGGFINPGFALHLVYKQTLKPSPFGRGQGEGKKLPLAKKPFILYNCFLPVLLNSGSVCDAFPQCNC
jgi:hypothetical protein